MEQKILISPKRGSVLLICLGVLALLSLLGTTLIYIARTEETESKRYIDDTRADFAAESGLETALAKLAEYKGSLCDLPTAAAAHPDTPGLPTEYLIRSSFGILDTDNNGEPDAAGSVSDTYVKDGDYFRLRITSTQSKLNINDSNSPLNIDTDPYEDQLLPERDYSQIPVHLQHPSGKDPDWVYPANGKLPYPNTIGRLENIIMELVDVLFPPAPTDFLNKDRAKKVASALIITRKNKANDSFDTMAEVREAVVKNGLLNDDQYKIFESFLTLDSWRDKNVLRPTFQWRINTPHRNDPADPKSAHVTWWPGDYSIHSGLEQWGGGLNFGTNQPAPRPLLSDHAKDIYIVADMQTKFFETESRSPVDVNNAPLPLLKALIRPVKGWYLKEAPSAGEAPRAEDWSEVVDGELGDSGALNISYYTWSASRPISYVFRHSAVDGGATTWGCGGMQGPDHCHYYYYDQFAYSAPEYDENSSVWDFRYPGKSKRFGELNLTTITKALANQIASAIHNRVHSQDLDGDGQPDFQPFRTWQEFETFMLDLSQDDGAALGYEDPNFILGFNRHQADSLIANFNPNSRLNDFNPNKDVFLSVDKSQLSGFSSEFCLQPMGIYNIESLGDIKNGSGNIISSSKLSCSVKLQEAFRLSTQEQFLRGYNDSKGVSPFVNESDAVANTAGSSANYNGASLQSYPEPEAFGANFIRNSNYDGYLMLATFQPNREDLMPASQTGQPAPIAANRFYVSYNGILNAEFSEPNLPNLHGDSTTSFWKAGLPWWTGFIDSNYPPDTTGKIPYDNPALKPLTCSVKNYIAKGSEYLPGNLFPDGAISDTGRALQYEAKNIGNNDWRYKGKWDNLNYYYYGKNGSLQFWVKPNYNVAHSNRIRSIFSLMTGEGYPKEFQMYYFSHGGPSIETPYSDNAPANIVYETSPTRSIYFQLGQMSIWTTSINQSWRTPEEAPSSGLNSLFHFEGNQWNHVAVSWLYDEPNPSTSSSYYYGKNIPNFLRFALNGREIENDRFFSWASPYWDYDTYYNASGNDYPPYVNTEKPNYIRFGEGSNFVVNNYSGDSTYDDIVSSKVPHDIDVLGLEYSYGRYYPGNTDNPPIYTSPEFDLFTELACNSGNLSLREIAWTGYWPKTGNSQCKADDIRFNSNRFGNNVDMYVDTLGLLHPKVLNTPRQDSYYFPEDPMTTFWGNALIPFSIDVYDNKSSNWYYADSSLSNPAVDMPMYAGGSSDPLWEDRPLSWKPGDKIRFRVYFNIDDSQTLFVSPVFDDITFVLNRDSAQILRWEMIMGTGKSKKQGSIIDTGGID